MSLVCDNCDKCYVSQSSLNRHLREKHGIDQKIMKSHDANVHLFNCLEGCKISFRFNYELRLHLKNNHLFDMQEEMLNFDSFNEFKIWLNEFETNSAIKYLKKFVKKSNNSTITYFNCHRSGKLRQINCVRRRQLKSQGYCKINTACTSYIKLIQFEDGKCSMKCSKLHYGHSIEVKHLRLTKNFRSNIAKKLAIGVNKSRIIDANRNAIEGQLSRDHLLTRKDIDNIKTSFNIHIQEGIRHKNDALSVDLFVKECQANENNPILFYKPQGENDDNLSSNDFCLIIMNNSQKEMLIEYGKNIIAIDSTHGLNGYDFELTTVMVVDNFGEGFLGACMLTNRKDTLVFEIFFNSIKSKIGALEVKTFMTDITNVFYNAWVAVMGPVKSRLLCSWHVDQAWRKNLNKIGDMEKRQLVYRNLKVIQQATDQGEFHVMLNTYITSLLSDETTRRFGDYFKEYYGSNPENWAYCYRKNCGINTNMRLEIMHKILKHFYLEGKKIKRLDKGLHALHKYIRDKIVDRLIKNIKGKSTSHINAIKSRHESAKSSVFSISQENSNWLVKSADNIYEVSKNSTGICCNITCSECNICIHSYNCTCVDFFIKSTICKHIHKVNMSLDRKNNTMEQEVDYESENHIHVNTLTSKSNEEHEAYGGCSSKQSELKENLRAETIKLEEHLTKKIDESVLAHVLKTIKNTNNLLEVSVKNDHERQDFTALQPNEPVNKRIAEQRKLFSTKRRHTIKKKLISRPSQKSTLLIKSNLMKLGCILKNIDHDHNYV